MPAVAVERYFAATLLVFTGYKPLSHDIAELANETASGSILAARGIPVDAEARARVEACQDPPLLRRWVARAMTATSAADLFGPDP